MEHQIQSSLDWPVVQTALEAPLHRMKKYTHEMWNISHNIGLMVKELSKEEINCRRQQRQTRLHAEQLAKINASIADYERMITFAVLLAG
jgi:PP-loop superfamily ATP-utilizing enzyme